MQNSKLLLLLLPLFKLRLYSNFLFPKTSPSHLPAQTRDKQQIRIFHTYTDHIIPKIKMIFLTIIATFVSSITSVELDWDDHFTYNNILKEDSNGDVLFKLYWKDIHQDVHNKSNDMIEFGLEVQSTGWIAIGISPNNMMPNSDIMLGWVDDNGKVYLYDMYTKTERITPFLDEHNDLLLLDGEEVDGITRIRFSRPKFLCNDEDLKVQIGTTRILFASNDKDPESISSGLIQHTLFGGKSINLDTGYQTLYDNDPLNDRDDILTTDILMENHSIPAQETQYFCQLFEMPQLDDMHHIVKFEPWITPGMEPYVHHIIIYHCPSERVNASNIGHGADCDSWGVEENMPAKACIGLGNVIYIYM